MGLSIRALVRCLYEGVRGGDGVSIVGAGLAGLQTGAGAVCIPCGAAVPVRCGHGCVSAAERGASPATARAAERVVPAAQHGHRLPVPLHDA